MSAAFPRVGMFPPPDLLDWDPATARAFLAQIAAAGIDHVCCARPRELRRGPGLRRAACRPPRWPRCTPRCRSTCGAVPAAAAPSGPGGPPARRHRRLAPGPADLRGRASAARTGTRWRSAGWTRPPGAARMDECLTVLRELLTGEGGHLPRRVLRPGRRGHRPAPRRPIPIIVGGRSDAAIRRAGRLGDGWLGHLELAPALRRRRRAGRRGGRPRRPARPAGPARDAGLVRARRLQGGGPRLPGPGHAGVLPAPVRAVRALLPRTAPRPTWPSSSPRTSRRAAPSST